MAMQLGAVVSWVQEAPGGPWWPVARATLGITMGFLWDLNGGFNVSITYIYIMVSKGNHPQMALIQVGEIL